MPSWRLRSTVGQRASWSDLPGSARSLPKEGTAVVGFLANVPVAHVLVSVELLVHESLYSLQMGRRVLFHPKIVI